MTDDDRDAIDPTGANARVRALEAELEASRVNAQDAEQQILTARENFGKLEAEIRAAREGATDLEAQLEAARVTVADLRAQLVGARRERERLLESVEAWRSKAIQRKPFWHALLPRGHRSALPPEVRKARDRIGRRFLRGHGIEIGALHSPVALGSGAAVRYVDRLSTEALLREYPEQAEYDLVDVDLVDDGERLERIERGSLDFLIANHMLEHCENPLGTLRTHLEKLRPGGVLYYIVPDRRGSFDHARSLTTFEHLERDDRDGPEHSRLDHYREYAEKVEKVPPDEIETVARSMIDARSNIHFHVWEDSTFRAFFERAATYLGVSLEILHFGLAHAEVTAVLRKQSPGPGEG